MNRVPFAHTRDYHLRVCEKLDDDTKCHVHHLFILLTQHFGLLVQSVFLGKPNVLSLTRMDETFFPLSKDKFLVTKEKHM